MSIKPVIAVTLFNRPSYTRILFNALSKCYGVSEIPVVISQDWNSECAAQCVEVRDVANAFLATHAAGGEYFCNDPKLGIDLNKLFVIPKAFERGDYMIFFEDDTPMGPDALNYFIAMGERFKDDKSIASISGYNRFPMSEWVSRKERPYEIERCTGFVPWGWSCHKDRWDEMFSNDGERYKSETGDSANGLFDHNWNGKNLGYIRPVVGRTNHVGWEGATHTPSREFMMEHEYCVFGGWTLDVPNNIHAWD